MGVLKIDIVHKAQVLMVNIIIRVCEEHHAQNKQINHSLETNIRYRHSLIAWFHPTYFCCTKENLLYLLVAD